MNVDIVDKKPEQLMKRIAFTAKTVFEGKTPSRQDLRKEIAKALGAKEDLVVLRQIKTDYGSERAIITGFVYETPETLKRLEKKYMAIRHLSKADQKTEKEKIKTAKMAAKSAAAAAKKK